jgi:prepilin-type processing-associated H-X9-DG protein
VSPVDIRDGMSRTVCVGERSVNLNANFGNNVIQVGAPIKNQGRGQATWVGAVPGASLWSCAPLPNDPDSGICVKEDGSGMILGHTGEGHGPGDPRADVNQFLSQHGRGSNFLFCDGHVEFLHGEINYPIYKALSTRANGEVFSDGY